MKHLLVPEDSLQRQALPVGVACRLAVLVTLTA